MDIGANLGQQRLAGARARHRHRWFEDMNVGSIKPVYRCMTCRVLRDDAKSKRGTSSRRLGHDQERRIERVYGPRKVGEFGDAIDLLGRDFMWQSKSTRREMPANVLRTGIWSTGGVPGFIGEPMEAMRALRQDKMPLLIRSWVRRGLPTVDVIYVRGDDWSDMHMHDSPQGWGFVAMTGQHFLDVHGRDEP